MIVMTSAAATNVGKIRRNNEDNYFLCGRYKKDNSVACQNDTDCQPRPEYLYAVCDGMGGNQYGEVASLLAAELLCEYQESFIKRAPDYFMTANNKICREIDIRDGTKMGTTFVGLCISSGTATVFNLGDSRAYLLRDNALRQLSVDHTLTRQMINQGLITPEEAATHPGRHKLTQHLGILPEEMMIMPHEATAGRVLPGDTFLLCSDGLTDALGDEQLQALLSSAEPPEITAQTLIDAALENGSRDNITAIVAKASEQGGKPCTCWGFFKGLLTKKG